MRTPGPVGTTPAAALPLITFSETVVPASEDAKMADRSLPLPNPFPWIVFLLSQ